MKEENNPVYFLFCTANVIGIRPNSFHTEQKRIRKNKIFSDCFSDEVHVHSIFAFDCNWNAFAFLKTSMCIRIWTCLTWFESLILGSSLGFATAQSDPRNSVHFKSGPKFNISHPLPEFNLKSCFNPIQQQLCEITEKNNFYVISLTV